MGKNILIIIPYKFIPPQNGGSLYCYNLVSYLSDLNKVSVLTVKQDIILLQNSKQGSDIDYFFVEENIKTSFFLKVKNKIKFIIRFKTIKNKPNDIFFNYSGPVKKILSQNKTDIVIFQNIETLYYLHPIFNRFRKKPGKKIVYNAHNVDFDLWGQLFQNTNEIKYETYSRIAWQIESNLGKYADIVISLTKNDQILLENLNKSTKEKIKFVTIPIGVEIYRGGFDNKFHDKEKKILFCGSLDYTPNFVGIKWFYYEVLPKLKFRLKNFKVIIIGYLNRPEVYNFLKGDNYIELIGTVESVLPYYEQSYLSIIPLLSGSGMRTKILEAMNFNCPCISTNIGASGIEFIPNSILIADSPDEFIEAIVHLFEDPISRNIQTRQAKKLIENKYDWFKLIGDYNRILNEI